MVVIRLGPSFGSRPAADRFAAEVLLDASGLLVASDAAVSATTLEVVADATAMLEPLAGAGQVRVHPELLREVTDVAGAAAEQRSTERDRHGRVPSAEHPLVRAGTERSPVVSERAMELRAAAAVAAGAAGIWTVAPWPGDAEWAASLTHDVDVLTWWPLFSAWRGLELLRHREGGRLARTVGAAIGALGRDPLLTGATSLARTLEARGIRATWYFLYGAPTVGSFVRGDLTYHPSARPARALLDTVMRGGHEIGLHGSFATATDAACLAAQREALRQASGQPVSGVRQHFLRMHPGPTQRHMVDAGFTHDATYGFPDRSGFRLGLATSAPGWDAEDARVTALEEVPLVWMDRALSKYRGIEDPAAWADDARETMAACRAVNGWWVGLWHPNLVAPMGYPGADAALHAVLDAMQGGAWIAPVGELVAWRQWRRELRGLEGRAAGDPPRVVTGGEVGLVEQVTLRHLPSSRAVPVRVEAAA